ncbi:hypothetical protein HU200_037253 [Digitaria exilis]|uniref:UDP-glycosyltransferases domain-containing protein n=1 Tax=Digitaria exilis TaxID=1010633 RepID=A0A835BF93_9POAL|nr:hypothetical protein HU200_037253 [Digitaria exilis]
MRFIRRGFAVTIARIRLRGRSHHFNTVPSISFHLLRAVQVQRMLKLDTLGLSEPPLLALLRSIASLRRLRTWFDRPEYLTNVLGVIIQALGDAGLQSARFDRAVSSSTTSAALRRVRDLPSHLCIYRRYSSGLHHVGSWVVFAAFTLQCSILTGNTTLYGGGEGRAWNNLRHLLPQLADNNTMVVQEMANHDDKTKKHVVIYAPPVMITHLVTLVELGELLAAHGLDVTIALAGRTDDDDKAAGSFAEGAAAAHPELSFHRLPHVTRPRDVPVHDPVAQTFELARASNSDLREFLRAASPSPAALVLDFFCGSAVDVGAELGIPTYFFFTSSISGLVELLYHPVIHDHTTLSLGGGGILHVPGIPSIRVEDLPASYHDRDGLGYRHFLALSEQMCSSHGIIVNSFRSLEPRATDAIVSGLCTPPGRRTPPLHCVGPLVKLEEAGGAPGRRHECLAWLDGQPESSVVFLCFGTMGRFTAEQTRQVARGLETSGQRFLWVVRRPPGEDDADLDAILPDGFVARTEGKGLVVMSWAPQSEVLAHGAVGGFVTHCGWNSVLEAVMGGVPMLAWPMYAEQRLNKVFLVEELRLAVVLEGYDGQEMVRDEEVAAKVRWLMESDGGRELRERARAAMRQAKEALGEGGESRTSLLELRRRSTAMADAHVLVFPFPAQGHINAMLPFAAALLDIGVFVTFLHTDHNLRRASSVSVATSPRLRFVSIPDGLADDHPRWLGDMLELDRSLREVGAIRYRALLASLSSSGGRSSQAGSDDLIFPPVTCVVADGILTWAIDASEDLGVPALAFRTSSASSFLAYQTLPFPAGCDLDEAVHGVPGMDSFLRRRDLPSMFRRRVDTDGGVDLDPFLHMLSKATTHSTKARALVFNTAASLEGPALAHIAPRMRDVFAIGPLHAMPSPAPASGLWGEDDGCIAWLDGHADRSVVYVSLGSVAVITHGQLTEFLSGLVAAGHPFLWALRPDMVVTRSQDASCAPHEAIRAAAGSKARVVAWAPQREVLRHRAVGCFLTHSGWNSTLEGVVAGVPMVCWPFFGDQQINSRLVGAVWRNGLDMKDVCDRDVVERMVREAMESAEIRSSAQALADAVRRDVDDGGTSAREFQRLVRFIKGLSMEAAKPNDPASDYW